MTSSDRGPHPSANAEEWSDEEIDAAELEDDEDDEERARQKNRSALIGGIAVVCLVVLTAIGVYSVATNSREQPPAPAVVQQAPASP